MTERTLSNDGGDAVDLRVSSHIVHLGEREAKAVRYFCYTVGTVALLWLVSVLLLVALLIFGGVNALNNTGDGTSSLEDLTTETTTERLAAPDGVCSLDQIDVDPDC